MLGVIPALPFSEPSSPPPSPSEDEAELPLGRSPVIWSSSGSEPCSSRVVGGAVLVSLSSLSGPKRGCIWVSLGGAGPATDSEGEGVAMTASFRFLASLGCASSSLSPLARCWAIADVLANPGPRGGRCGWGGEYSYPSYPRACSIYNDHTTPSYPAFPRARSWVVVVVVVVGPPPQEKSNGTVQGRCKFLVFPFR